MLGDRMSFIDDRLVQMERNQEQLIWHVCSTYMISFNEYHFTYNPDGTLQHD